MTRLLLLRHGRTAAGDGVLLGRWDGGLDDRGRAQAGRVAAQLRGRRLAAVVSSPSQRAMQTAHLVAPCVRPRIDERLAERDPGAYAGLRWDEVERRDPAAAARWLSHGWPPSDAESPAAFVRRIGEAGCDLAGCAAGDVLVVTHGGPIRVLVSLARGIPPEEAARVRTEHGRLRAVRCTATVVARWREAAGVVR